MSDRAFSKFPHVADLIDGPFKGRFVLRQTSNIPALHHDDIQSDSQDAPSVDNNPDLIVAELPLPIANGPCVLMARMDTPPKPLDDLPERNIRKMRHIDRDTELFTVLEQFDRIERQADFTASPTAVSVGSVVGQPQGTKSSLMKLVNRLGSQDRIGTLHRQYEAQGGLGLPKRPRGARVDRQTRRRKTRRRFGIGVMLPMRDQVLFGSKHFEVTVAFHRAVISQMGMGHRIAGMRRGPSKRVIDRLLLASQKCGQAYRDF